MSYLDRLRAKEFQKVATPEPTKPTKAPAVGSVGVLPGHSKNIVGPANDREPAREPEASSLPSSAEADTAALERAYAFLKGRALARLEAGTADLAVIADDELAPGVVLVAVARRNKFVCILSIDPARYDGVRLLELVERHTLH